ncbi:hypothetical protein P280DRAFT_483532 [Massarina eburnea CBS 473.64]|uniref:Uncharacterized protein n=1 Tax=Massarina eburnea CBS 473.64 TaxID=1395130 RepID=A0A6A6RLS5_9PLEO|nr:hypothetical protein P280DRAFT_483532 [Massarina eburnea CBS 473.64]
MANEGSSKTAKKYNNFKKNFRTFLEVLDEVRSHGDAQRTGQVLATMYAIGVSLAAQCIHPSVPYSNWHRAFMPEYRQWLSYQADATGVDALTDLEEEGGHKIQFLNEYVKYIKPIVKSKVTARVRNSRTVFDGEDGDDYYPLWALRASLKACDVIETDFLEIAIEHLGNSINKEDIETSYRHAMEDAHETTDYPPFVSTLVPYSRSYIHEYYAGEDTPSVDDNNEGDNSSGNPSVAADNDEPTSILENGNLEDEVMESNDTEDEPSEDAGDAYAGAFGYFEDDGLDPFIGRERNEGFTPFLLDPSMHPDPFVGMPSLTDMDVDNPNLFPDEQGYDTSWIIAFGDEGPNVGNQDLMLLPSPPRARQIPVPEEHFTRAIPELNEPYKSMENFCSICREPYTLEEAQNGGIITPSVCEHYTHRRCLDTWINEQSKNTCPMCRRQLFDANDVGLNQQTEEDLRMAEDDELFRDLFPEFPEEELYTAF